MKSRFSLVVFFVCVDFFKQLFKNIRLCFDVSFALIAAQKLHHKRFLFVFLVTAFVAVHISADFRSCVQKHFGRLIRTFSDCILKRQERLSNQHFFAVFTDFIALLVAVDVRTVFD